MRLDPRKIKLHDRVLVLTSSGGCYDGVTGSVADLLDREMKSVPGGSPDVEYYDVRFDAPVDIGCGQMAESDIFPARELFEPGTAGTYWNPGKKTGPETGPKKSKGPKRTGKKEETK